MTVTLLVLIGILGLLWGRAERGWSKAATARDAQVDITLGLQGQVRDAEKERDAARMVSRENFESAERQFCLAEELRAELAAIKRTRSEAGVKAHQTRRARAEAERVNGIIHGDPDANDAPVGTLYVGDLPQGASVVTTERAAEAA